MFLWSLGATHHSLCLTVQTSNKLFQEPLLLNSDVRDRYDDRIPEPRIMIIFTELITNIICHHNMCPPLYVPLDMYLYKSSVSAVRNS